MNGQIPLFTTILFGALAVYLSFLEERQRKKFHKERAESSRRLYEISVLNRLSDEIGYSLNLKKIVDTVAENIGDLFHVSTISYVFIDEDKLLFKTYIKEPVGVDFLSGVKKIMLDAVYGIDEKARSLHIDETATGEIGSFSALPLSYFNVPLVMDKKFVGMINISSRIKSVFQEEDMSMLYRVINHVERALERLEGVIETEEGKINSMLFSISSGAIMFLFEEGSLRLSTINRAAREFLKIDGEANLTRVITGFSGVDLLTGIKKAFEEKKIQVLTDVFLNDKSFKIHMSPVFMHDSQKVIGVSITMLDLTLEKQLAEIREIFTNMVVHELRAPLTSIKGASELLVKGSLNKDDREKMLALIKNSTESMLDQVAELLDAAKIEAGKFTLQKEVSDVNESVRDKIASFSYFAASKEIEIVEKFDTRITPFEFDKRRIGQVLNNLLSNSIKFTHVGGRVEVATLLENGFVRISVTDNGIGMPKEKIGLLFSKYTQIESSKKGEGTGLGLYISKGIVDSHNGKIWAESEEGRGTTFYFTIPVVNPQEKTDTFPHVVERMIN